MEQPLTLQGKDNPPLSQHTRLFATSFGKQRPGQSPTMPGQQIADEQTLLPAPLLDATKRLRWRNCSATGP